MMTPRDVHAFVDAYGPAAGVMLVLLANLTAWFLALGGLGAWWAVHQLRGGAWS